MDEPNKRRKPRIFKWSRTARQAILANLNASGRELRKLITEISQQTGNPRDACLRFARQLGLKAKQRYRKWTADEHKKLENELEVHKVRKVAIRLGRTPTQVYGMMHRLGISGKKLTDKLSLYAVARAISKHPQVVRQWIRCGALEAENEGTERVPRWMISQANLQRFEKKHRKLIAASHVDRVRLRFICGYVFPVSDDLRTRESENRTGRVRRANGRRRSHLNGVSPLFWRGSRRSSDFQSQTSRSWLNYMGQSSTARASCRGRARPGLAGFWA